VLSTRSRSGTTWAQMICGLLIFQPAPLPAPLGQLSPWLDDRIAPRDEVHALLAAQRHRRFIKTHTPLDGLPLDPRVTFIVVARNPIDAAVSLYHHVRNIDRARLRELASEPLPTERSVPISLRDWLLSWIAQDADPRAILDSLPGIMWHLSDAWAKRGLLNVVLVRYRDLSSDLEGQMRRLAGLLGISVPEAAWPGLVHAASFEQMRARAGELVPAGGILTNDTAFFRRGRPGAAREVLTSEELAEYDARLARLASPDLLAWLHAPRNGEAQGMGL
jgi:aryl sulfotransferase